MKYSADLLLSLAKSLGFGFEGAYIQAANNTIEEAGITDGEVAEYIKEQCDGKEIVSLTAEQRDQNMDLDPFYFVYACVLDKVANLLWLFHYPRKLFSHFLL